MLGMAKAVCLVSGGLDSCVAAATAHAEGLDLAFLHIGYGQLTRDRELQAFHDIADFYSIEKRIAFEIPHLSQIGGSALTDRSIELPLNRDPDRAGIPASYVPFRNANLLSIATSWAEVLGAEWIYIGAVEEDSSGYPDCRRSFFDAFNLVIQEGTRPQTLLEVVAPLIHLSKADIVIRGLELRAPLHLTWSCYQAQDLACGVCDSCILRLRGFQLAGAADPIPYANRSE